MESDLQIDVIVPVHNQRAYAEACISSVRAARGEVTFELVVIDDASTDNLLKESLAASAISGEVTLLTNDENLGFTRSVNRGMRLHEKRDVVLLNSDTVVYDGWLDRLRRAAYSGPKIATVNPLTNGSHIGSYPFRSSVGEVTFEIADEQLNALAATACRDRVVEVHTTVGFCMYIRREALDDVGLFDAKYFPLGYGEESDFCYRARRIGWRHLIAGDAFVRHWEGQSFGERKTRLVEEMIAVFTRLHPDLAQKDQTFRERDPVRPLREALDLARLKLMLAGKTELTCLSAADNLVEGSEPALIFNSETGSMEFAAAGVDTMPNLPRFRLPQEIAAFNTVLGRLGVDTLAFADTLAAAELRKRLRGGPFDLQLGAVTAIRPR